MVFTIVLAFSVRVSKARLRSAGVWDFSTVAGMAPRFKFRATARAAGAR
jgi:hypothetical protein